MADNDPISAHRIDRRSFLSGVGAAAVDYLRIVGHLMFAYFWARMARVALDKAGSGDPFYAAKLATARFYFARLLPETAGLIRSARSGVAPLMAMDEAMF